MVDSGRDRLLFVFSARSVRDFYALPEPVASKGLADYRMLLRKLPGELFADRRTFAHDLFGAQEVEGYLGHLDTAIDRQLDELGDAGSFEVFALARRLGHRLALGCWMGDDAATPPRLDRLIADFEQLDGAEAFVHPERVAGTGADRSANAPRWRGSRPRSGSCSPRVRPTTGSSPRSPDVGTGSTNRPGARASRAMSCCCTSRR